MYVYNLWYLAKGIVELKVEGYGNNTYVIIGFTEDGGKVHMGTFYGKDVEGNDSATDFLKTDTGKYAYFNGISKLNPNIRKVWRFKKL